MRLVSAFALAALLTIRAAAPAQAHHANAAQHQEFAMVKKAKKAPKKTRTMKKQIKNDLRSERYLRAVPF